MACQNKFYFHFWRLACQISPKVKNLTSLRCRCSMREKESDKDIERVFVQPEVQEILRKITGYNVEKIFMPVKQRISNPRYKFVTDEELEKMVNHSRLRAEEKLQMPPVMNQTKHIQEFFSKDPELQSLNNCKYVFIDISPGFTERKRLIVTRYPDGTLHGASYDERKRMNHMYFPVPGRYLRMPKMFEEECLEKVLERQQYKFILDRACLQFDPDDPDYIRVTHRTYDHIEMTKSFDILRSTRHFGPMALYLVHRKYCDTLLLDMIQKELISDAANVVKLYHIIHPDSLSAQQLLPDNKDVTLIKAFAKLDSIKKSHIDLALQTFEELQTSMKGPVLSRDKTNTPFMI